MTKIYSYWGRSIRHIGHQAIITASIIITPATLALLLVQKLDSDARYCEDQHTY